MTVKKLIEELKKFDLNLTVVVRSYKFNLDDIESAHQIDVEKETYKISYAGKYRVSKDDKEISYKTVVYIDSGRHQD